MPTVAQAFHNFLTNLELRQDEQETASKKQNDLRDLLRTKMPGIARDILVGSYARRTAVRPLNDIDIFLILDPSVHGHRRSRPPLLLLEDLQRALRNCYSVPGPETRIQGRSVNIEFSGSSIAFDVIPAFSEGSRPGNYEIPDRNQETWIKTNPERHNKACIEANNRADGALNQLIKAAKHWNYRQGDADSDKPLRSFHLEVMAYSAFASAPRNPREGMAFLLEHLTNRISRPCPEPADLGPNLDADLTAEARKRAEEALLRASSRAKEAVRCETTDPSRAHEGWRELFGAEYGA
jgi:Second Messenger Oligonucleotide or Dinucleotide Synthetase domain